MSHYEKLRKTSTDEAREEEIIHKGQNHRGKSAKPEGSRGKGECPPEKERQAVLK